eukprot:scaffold18456_cov124-Isochrysis_galbana.AAC.2
MSIYCAVHPTFECLNAKKKKTWPWHASCLTNRARFARGIPGNLDRTSMAAPLACRRPCQAMDVLMLVWRVDLACDMTRPNPSTEMQRPAGHA